MHQNILDHSSIADDLAAENVRLQKQLTDSRREAMDARSRELKAVSRLGEVSFELSRAKQELEVMRSRLQFEVKPPAPPIGLPEVR